MNTKKMKRYTFNQLIGRLSNGKSISIRKTETKGSVTFNIDIEFSRMDVKFKENYSSETYLLSIEKYDSRYLAYNTEMLIDKRVKFFDLKELIDYLDKNNLVKREELIKNEP